MSPTATKGVSVSELVAMVRRQQEPGQGLPREPGKALVRGVSVVGAHRGAGATTVAVALADALDAMDRPATLLDLSPMPDAFAAAECEVDSGTTGWQAGRRGQTRVMRGDARAEAYLNVTSDLIVDGRRDTLPSHVLVCRATLPSVRCAEAALAPGTVLAVVASSRWPTLVTASLGPALRQAAYGGHVVFVPFDRKLELYGVDAQPLPASTRAAAQRVIGVIWPDLAGSSSPHRRGGIRR